MSRAESEQFVREQFGVAMEASRRNDAGACEAALNYAFAESGLSKKEFGELLDRAMDAQDAKLGKRKRGQR
ncbi:hypothetical protein [Actinosynnema pretiosum]|uniref:Uncharacterized protein n=1 Tax=Actinosynnema pretiosum TaxID=42197 RepID=A0A290Z3K7_9PSEU|nr:hypothetical protein [Actinosynnema pretiosum]ATE53616.1 hypothetical protein CNX65_10195 [Actinosynnema pretiosum]